MTHHQAQTTTSYFSPLAGSNYCLLTTYKRDGTPVTTPVHVVLSSDVAYFRTWDVSGKAKRLRHTPRVELQPCGARGKPKSDSKLAAVASLLEGRASQEAAVALARKHPVLHGLVIPRVHRRRGWTTQQYRLTAPPEPRPGRSEPA